ncbi:tellurite resistance protein TelA [Anoxybacillus gonensis]|uniref:Toxic anion resistance protein n=1 Tax=Anoxybacillus gonensis TaxID=198467 RepID=A0AAW7THL4_9BACL|nr:MULTISPECIES: toxic anion resistance protein [Anoxybacillus]AXM90233.1 toxic anion resistance protein [Anoxybacillus ayderensis G10]THD17586.1 toxic anion resistance protein [Anoxybacillus ayderensis]AKS38500.1 tellurite resistance protein TelA [Anoxybacillus gonensis]KGP59756.1 tellurite resistance protein TelA [Anoxybacillus gonensis]MBW9218828.1 toxic anion resistance protein [Anoxybacillus sp. ST70]
MSKNDEMLWTSSIDSLLANPFGEVTEVTDKPSSSRFIDQLKEEHRQKALALAEQIDPRNHQAILQYGVAAQAELSRFSHSILNHVQKKDVGPVGEVIQELMTKMKEVNVEDFAMNKKSFFARMFQSVTQSVQHILSKYQKLGVDIDRIADQLEKHRQMLFRDIMMLETLYEKNKEYFDALNIYIAAAELKLEQLRTKTIPELEKKALQSQNQMDVQEVNDMIQFADRLEKRIHDLKLSRQITIQTAPQIRLIQHVNQTLVERIQSSILTAIPLWKNQLVIALTLLRQKKAVEAQKAVTKTTNELLLRNSEMLKMNTIEAAKENEEGLVSIETLKKTQENLLETLEETLKIQQEGRMKRQRVEQELIDMEEQLKQRLLTLKRAE